MKLVKTLATAALALLMAQPVFAQGKPEKTDLQLVVGGKPLLYYLPLTIAERKGYFKDEGLNVTISDFAGGAKSLQALIGGSADVTIGAYDHTIQMQAKNQPIRAVVLLDRYSGMALGISKAKAAQYKSVADLKGWKIGVTAPGSSTNFLANYLLAKEGLKPTDVSFIGIGGGPSAVASVKRGEVDALINLDPVISQLQASGDIKVVLDGRTTEGANQLYGGPYPAAVMYTTEAFVEKNPNTVQALVNAFVRTLIWMQKASPEEITATVPPEFLAGDKDLYMAALKNSMQMYSPDGLFSMPGAENALKVLAAFDESVKSAKIDLAKTYTNSFVEKALEKHRK